MEQDKEKYAVYGHLRAHKTGAMLAIHLIPVMEPHALTGQQVIILLENIRAQMQANKEVMDNGMLGALCEFYADVPLSLVHEDVMWKLAVMLPTRSLLSDVLEVGINFLKEADAEKLALPYREVIRSIFQGAYKSKANEAAALKDLKDTFSRGTTPTPPVPPTEE